MKRFKTSYQIQKGKGINRKMQINEKLRRKSQLQMRIGDDLFISQVGPTKTPTGKKRSLSALEKIHMKRFKLLTKYKRRRYRKH